MIAAQEEKDGSGSPAVDFMFPLKPCAQSRNSLQLPFSETIVCVTYRLWKTQT
ncbi:MAG: hypothetical protein QOE34_903 [Verrucomicrobiota bacterium]|jgi:hypothetical protein